MIGIFDIMTIKGKHKLFNPYNYTRNGNVYGIKEDGQFQQAFKNYIEDIETLEGIEEKK